MTTWQALLLGVIQGLTEFLPVSSSGHLALAQYLFGFEHLQNFIFFNLVCHLGTLVTILYVFFQAIKECVLQGKGAIALLLGTLPLFPLVLVMKPLKGLFDQPQFLGPCFLVSALFLFAGIYLRLPLHGSKRDALTIGLAQAVAILPGISRSGATVSAARILGWQKEQAITFSFLLAIPTIVGGMVLEVWQIARSSSSALPEIDPLSYITGFVTSCLVGFFSLRLTIRAINNNQWGAFAWYCLFVGITTTIYFNVL